MVVKNYEHLDIYKKSYELAMDIHNITMNLPRYELFEEGSQIRRASKSIVINIVEGYGRKRYQNEFIRFLTFAHSSCDETKVHLNFIFNSGYITKKKFDNYFVSYDHLGRMINNFIKSIKQQHKS